MAQKNNAFNRGASDFNKTIKLPKGYFVQAVNPYQDFAQSREWERGYNSAYFKNRGDRDET